MNYENEEKSIVVFILANLLEELGGVVELDASKILNDIKSGRNKEIKLSIKDGKAVVEVFDENEN